MVRSLEIIKARMHYLHSNKIGEILCHKHEQFTLLKAEVEQSQAINKPNHITLVMLQNSGNSWMLLRSWPCSHATAVLWKVGIYE